MASLVRVPRHIRRCRLVARPFDGYSSMAAVSKPMGQSAFWYEGVPSYMQRFCDDLHTHVLDRCRVCVLRSGVLLSCCVHVYHLRRGCNAIGDMDGASLLSARVVVSGTVRSDFQLSYKYDRTSSRLVSGPRQDCHVSVLLLPAVYNLVYSKANTLYC